MQYGFETTGVTVWPTDAGSFGSVRIVPFSGSPFDAWITNQDFTAFTAANLSPAGDPDGDGRSNFEEFALNNNPRSPGISGKVRTRLQPVDGGNALVLTLPVRGTPEFTGNPWKTATIDGVTYMIEGSNGLSEFDQIVSEIPASAAGMPLPDTGWNYRSFRLGGVIGGSTPRGPSGYLRVRMAEAP